MLAVASRSSAVLAAAVAIVLMPAACSSSRKAVTASASTGAPTVTPVSPNPSASGPMTAAELVWLYGIGTLHKTMDKIVLDSPSTLTSKSMRSLSTQFAGCSSALDRLGAATDRLRPVHELAAQGCVQYEKAAACFATAAKMGIVVAGSADDKKQQQAIECGFAAPGDGSKLFAEAELKGAELGGASQ